MLYKGLVRVDHLRLLCSACSIQIHLLWKNLSMAWENAFWFYINWIFIYLFLLCLSIPLQVAWIRRLERGESLCLWAKGSCCVLLALCSQKLMYKMNVLRISNKNVLFPLILTVCCIVHLWSNRFYALMRPQQVSTRRLTCFYKERSEKNSRIKQFLPSPTGHRLLLHLHMIYT